MNTITKLRSVLVLLMLCMPSLALAQDIPLTTDSEEARAAFEEGATLMENLRSAEARPHFDKAIAADPDFALAHLFRALTSDSQMDYLAHLGHAVERADQASEGERLMILSYQAYADGKADERRKLAKQLAEKYPKDKHAGYLYATAQEEPADQAKQLEKLVEMAPDYAPAYNILGYSYRSMGDYDKAEQAFKTYAELLPDEPNPYDSMADLYMKMGRFEDAIANYEKALERSPTFAISQEKIGVSYDLMGRHDEARKAYEKRHQMAESPSEKVDALLAMSESHLYEGNYQKAIEKVDKAIDVAETAGQTPQVAWNKLRKAWMAHEHGKVDEAQAYLEEARAYAKKQDLPKQVLNNFENAALWGEAALAAKQGNHEAAMASADALKARLDQGLGSADKKMYHGLVGVIYLQQGDAKKAVKHLSQGDQEDPYVLYQLGLAEAKSGNKEKAAELMQKAADWNEGDLVYALVRPQAKAWLKDNGQAKSSSM